MELNDLETKIGLRPRLAAAPATLDALKHDVTLTVAEVDDFFPELERLYDASWNLTQVLQEVREDALAERASRNLVAESGGASDPTVR